MRPFPAERSGNYWTSSEGRGTFCARVQVYAGRVFRLYREASYYFAWNRHGKPGNSYCSGKKSGDEADLIIGAKRMADAVRGPGQAVVYEYRSDVIVEYIKKSSGV